MKLFEDEELDEARAYSATGEIAIHLHSIVFPNSPQCFKRDVAAGLPIAHVFCSNKERLRRTALEMGVRVIFFHRENTPSQHVDMCGAPLRRLLALIDIDIEKFRRIP